MPTPEEPASAFADLGLSSPLVSATAAEGYAGPTEVQTEVIPAVLAGSDVWASAPTGSGKTASFVLPLLERLASGEPRGRRAISALILAPTRELAAQIGECVRAYSQHLNARLITRVTFGGVSINVQMKDLRGGADIVVATPGRLLDLASKNAVVLSAVRTLVLDEADRLLESGFRDELNQILALVPEQRQTLLFSATFPKRVGVLADAVLDSPIRVNVVPDEPEEPNILERAIEVDKKQRTQLLRHLIETMPAVEPPARNCVLVFVATTYATEHVSRKLRDLGIPAAAMHGKLSQGARTAALAGLHSGEVGVLLATDLAARGIDVEQLTMVVNYDLPRSPRDYVHRIGRTGRAGAAGVAVSFVTAENGAHFRLIEKRGRKQITREQIPGFEPTDPEVAPERAKGSGGIKGKRKSKKDKLREAAARAARSAKDDSFYRGTRDKDEG